MGHMQPSRFLVSTTQRFLVLDQTLEDGSQPRMTLVQNWFEELKERVPVN